MAEKTNVSPGSSSTTKAKAASKGAAKSGTSAKTRRVSESVAEPVAEELDVLIIGAGLSGIGAAHHLQTNCPWASYAILESRERMGGTWDLFRYPGIRSDSDMFTLSYEFSPWKGEKSISDGASILEYINKTASDAGIDEHIRYSHKVLTVDWSSDDARWHVSAQNADGQEIALRARFIISCTGYYRYESGYLPDFKGIDTFEGTIAHPQFWPEDLDYADKDVIIIGSGATAITLVPAMAPVAATVTMLQRSPTYLLSLPSKNPVANALRTVLPTAISGPLIRWTMATGTFTMYNVSRSAPSLVKKVLRRQVERALPKGYDVEKHFVPHYQPWDERVCVVTNGDLFKEISRGKVEMVTDHIKEFTPKGILLESDEEIQADIIVPATGLDVLFLGGIDLRVDGEVVDPGSRLSYKGTMLEGVPNMAIIFGYTNASWTLKADLSSNYVCRLLNEMRSDDVDYCVPENNDESMDRLPMLNLSSGYVTRALDKLPKQGAKFPWQVKMSVFSDYKAIKMSSLRDEALRFGRLATDRNAKATSNGLSTVDLGESAEKVPAAVEG